MVEAAEIASAVITVPVAEEVGMVAEPPQAQVCRAEAADHPIMEGKMFLTALQAPGGIAGMDGLSFPGKRMILIGKRHDLIFTSLPFDVHMYKQ